MKDYAKIYTCPNCGSNEVIETDYEPIKGKDGETYQYYACVCADCKRKYYNVARYIGALTADQFNALSADKTFSEDLDEGDQDLLERYERLYKDE